MLNNDIKPDYIINGISLYSLSLAYYLSKINKKCLLIDTELINTELINTENKSTKKLYLNSNYNFIYLLKNININFNDSFKPSKLQFSLSNFSMGELLLIFSEFLSLFFSDYYSKNITIDDYTYKNNFSDKTKQYIDLFIDKQSSLYELLELFNVLFLYQIYEPINNNLIKDIKNKLIENDNIIIKSNNIYSENNVITNNKKYSIVENEITDSINTLYNLEPTTKTLFKNYRSDNFIDIIKFLLLIKFILYIFTFTGII